MKRLIVFYFLFFLIQCVYSQEVKFPDYVLENPKLHSDTLEKLFNINEVYEFDTSNRNNAVVLENGYVKYILKDQHKWPPKIENDALVTQIDIIITKYPRQKEFWRTNYHELLANRLNALFKLAPELNSNSFEWNLVLQTKCKTESQARSMFHGIVITYTELKEADNDIDESYMQDSAYFNRNSLKVQNFINSFNSVTTFPDTVLSEYPEWDNAMVVLDWTASMHQYSAQIVKWHIDNYYKSGIRYFSFFNDGDNTKNQDKIIGRTEGVYFCKARNVEQIINMFYYVTSKGRGGDDEENDIEALMLSTEKFPDFDQIILVADNKSCIRDFRLIKQLDVKVHIILCGVKDYINPQYVNLAYQTGGSLQTEHYYIDNIAQKIVNDSVMIEEQLYVRNEKDILWHDIESRYLAFNECNRFSRYLIPDENKITDFITESGGITDSTVTHVLDRNKYWDKSLIVMDWTQGMYSNSSQAVLWHKRHLKESGINYFTFFNDGDKKKKREKKIGSTFGVYGLRANNVKKVMTKFAYVKKKGDGGKESEENDIEAVMRSAAKYKKNKNLILIADNKSCIRDIRLLDFVSIPVKVVLCNVNGPVNPQYINLAYKSGGSLHLDDDDIFNYVFKTMVQENRPLLINEVEYILNEEGYFVFKDEELQKEDCSCSKFYKIGFFKRILNI